jgi:predicted ATP-dependent endonuclease of OLD family
LEALDIFFNEGDGIIKADDNDLNIEAKKQGMQEYSITVEFNDLPEYLIIDATHKTRLKDEYLLNENGCLLIKKVYHLGAKKLEVFIEAKHPTNKYCEDLLTKKISELRNIIEKNKIPCEDKNTSSALREAIWNYYKDDLQLKTKSINISSKTEQTKEISEKLQKYFPMYFLFQADRKNSDGDDEIQDPLKIAVKEIIESPSIQQKLTVIANEVKNHLSDVAERTMKVLESIDPNIAKTLDPKLPEVNDLKWKDVFKSVSIFGGDGIPINKRGSGVKRLVLMSFFRAEVQRRAALKQKENGNSVIYAIEEPETSQHIDKQKVLITALKKLSQEEDIQILITTHSTEIVKELGLENIIIIEDKNSKYKDKIRMTEEAALLLKTSNEVNYLAFGFSSYEYYDELYAEIFSKGLFKNGKNQFKKFCGPRYKEKPYRRYYGGELKPPENVGTYKYIRDQIHHPENVYNKRFTEEEFEENIKLMRGFLLQNINVIRYKDPQ